MASKDSTKAQNKPVSAVETDANASEQEKATLPDVERGDNDLAIGDTGASSGAEKRYEEAGGLAKSDESNIPNQEPDEDEDDQMSGESDAEAHQDAGAETESGSPKVADIRPDFFSMDEAGVKEWFDVNTRYLRDRGMTVNGPTQSEATQKAANAPVGVAAEQSTKRDAGDITIYETFYQWRKGNDTVPLTVRATALDKLEAYRNAAQEAMVRRNEL